MTGYIVHYQFGRFGVAPTMFKVGATSKQTKVIRDFTIDFKIPDLVLLIIGADRRQIMKLFLKGPH